MIKFASSLILVLGICATPSLAQEPNYDMSSFDTSRKSAGESRFRITPDMFPKHSYQRMQIMKKYGPKGKPVGFSKLSGKAFDYLNPETLKDKRNKARSTDIYLDNAYDAPSIDKSYDPAYAGKKKSFSSQLKPLGSKHNQGNNPFSNTVNSNQNSSYSKPFTTNRYSNKFNNNAGSGDKSYLNPTVFDGESMF